VSYLDRLFGLDGKTILVTGASRGIGATLAAGLAGAGAQVVGLSRSPRPSAVFPASAEYLSCDITDRAELRRVVLDVQTRRGRIDVLLNVAGVSVAADRQDAALQFDRIVDINLKATYGVCEQVAAGMKQTGGGSIINVTSIGSVLGFPNNPGYVASKGGLRMLTRALALDLAPFGIRVNNLVPGYIHTEMTEASYSDLALRSARESRMMLPRWGEPDDLCGAAIYLASAASAYVTGIDLTVDGGWTAKGL
jgi:NAD(P)-dependent dehydrogenase (short-subunit alcohol dehydrogenase family)